MKRYIRIIYQITFSVVITYILSTVRDKVYKNYSNSGIDGQMSSKDATKQKQSRKLYVDHNWSILKRLSDIFLAPQRRFNG